MDLSLAPLAFSALAARRRAEADGRADQRPRPTRRLRTALARFRDQTERRET
jgi:hypothetical protein